MVPNSALLIRPSHLTAPKVGDEDAIGTLASLRAEHVSFRCMSADRNGIPEYIPGLQYALR